MTDGDRPSAYVPGLLADWMRTTPTARSRAVDGTLVLVDVAGFTALTERLARAGRVGAEETSDLLSAVFTDLLRIAFGHGGRLVKWGGDAVLLLFEGDGHAVNGCLAAWRMRAALRHSGRACATAGAVRLRMSVGVHTGRVELYLVGTVHRELIVAGAAARQVVRLQSAAATGQILVGPRTARLVGPAAVGDHSELSHRPHTRPCAPIAHEHTRGTGSVGGPAALLPAAVWERLTAGTVEGEHRRVVVGFVEFSGVSALHRQHGRRGVWQALQELIGLAQDACRRWSVTFLETDVGTDGGKILLVAGAPRSHGHDGERLVRVLQEILAHRGPLRVRCGANAGRVFAGGFGPPEQRTYSVKGDAVNLAARVMAHARSGRLLATPAVLGARASAFACTPVPAFRVKGKRAPVTAAEIGEPRRTGTKTAAVTPLVGRQSELCRLRDLLDAARAGRGSSVLVCGPPGIGKSRLAAELAGGCHDARVVSVCCEQARANTPYALFESLLRELLGMPEASPDAVVARALVAAVHRGVPRLRAWLPLLGAVVRTELPPTRESESLADEFRGIRLEEVLVELVTALLPGPALLLVDDAQLADTASAGVLTRLLDRLAGRPWLVVLNSTHDLTYPEPEAHRIRLGPLDAPDVALLLTQQTHDAPLLPHLRAAVAERAAGNPLFLRELIPLAERTAQDADLPESVEDVLAAEIDRLPPQDRRLLRAAAVCGMRVDAGLLGEALGQAVAPDAWQRLAGFVTPDGEGRLRFRHALVRDVAYQGLSYRRRRLLHGALGRALQRRAGASPDAQADAMARHFFHAQSYPAAAHYARIAGERAAALYANADAEVALSYALDAARRRQPPMPEEVARLTEACGDIRCRLGEFAAAESAYRSARRGRRDDPVATARLHRKTAQVVAHTRGFPHALACVTRGRHVLAGSTGSEATREDARLLVQAALMRQMQGRYDDTDSACRAAITAATRAGARDVLAQAFQLLDAADVARGRLDGEPWAQRALVIWQERNDLAWQARAQNQIGIRAYFAGRWGGAMSHYQGAAAAFGRVGDEWNAAITACNVGEILADQGRLAEAEKVTRPAAEVLRASGALSESAFACGVLGRTALRDGRVEEAQRLLQSSRAGYVKAGERAEILATDLRLAECLLAQGHWAEATAQIACLHLDAADPAGRMTAGWLRGHALAQQGRLEAAAAAIASSLTSARSGGARYPELLALDALIRLDSARQRTPGPAQVTARADLCHRLGVVAVPSLPLAAPPVVADPGGSATACVTVCQ